MSLEPDLAQLKAVYELWERGMTVHNIGRKLHLHLTEVSDLLAAAKRQLDLVSPITERERALQKTVFELWKSGMTIREIGKRIRFPLPSVRIVLTAARRRLQND